MLVWIHLINTVLISVTRYLELARSLEGSGRCSISIATSGFIKQFYLNNNIHVPKRSIFLIFENCSVFLVEDRAAELVYTIRKNELLQKHPLELKSFVNNSNHQVTEEMQM